MPKKQHFANINKVKRPDGGYYYYHRRTGARIDHEYGSPDFARAWAIEESKAIQPKKPEQDRYSYGGLWSAFKTSEEWKVLAPRTQADYDKVRRWMYNQDAGGKLASELTQARCEIILDRAIEDLGWRQGVYVLQVNRLLYRWVTKRAARKSIWGGDNPWRDIETPPKPKPKRKPNRSWTPAEVAEVLERAPLGLRRAYVLGASGFDGETMCEREWEEYRNGCFSIDREKTGVPSVVMVPRILRPFLEDGDRPHARIVTAIPGHPFTVGGLQKRSSEFLRGLAKDGVVGPGLTLHGLRHTIAKAIADTGGSFKAIQAALQHKSARMSLHYSAEADKTRALLAAADGLDSWFDVQNGGQPDCKTGPADAEYSSENKA